MLSLVASLYLLLRRSNCIAPDITPPLRLRRWAAAFFAAIGVGNIGWLTIYYCSPTIDLFTRVMLCTALDAAISLPTILCTMLVMLQDRRRPLWPVAVVTVFALAMLLAIYVLDVRNLTFAPLLGVIVFILICFVMVRAIRQYDRWLRDNYADLEHKEVRTTFVVMAAFILIILAYYFANYYYFFQVFIEIADILFICILLWRVETLQTLTEPADDASGDAKKLW